MRNSLRAKPSRTAMIRATFSIALTTFVLSGFVDLANATGMVPLSNGPISSAREAAYQLTRCAALSAGMSQLVDKEPGNRKMSASLVQDSKNFLVLAQVVGPAVGQSSSDILNNALAMIPLYVELWNNSYIRTGDNFEEITKNDMGQCAFIKRNPEIYFKSNAK